MGPQFYFERSRTSRDPSSSHRESPVHLGLLDNTSFSIGYILQNYCIALHFLKTVVLANMLGNLGSRLRFHTLNIEFKMAETFLR